MKSPGHLFFTLSALAALSCTPPETPKLIEYDGPLREARQVEMFYNEKDRVKVRLQTPRILEMQNGDREFPEGLDMEFFDEAGKLSSTLRANYAYYYKADNKWLGRGKVEVKNMAQNQQLNTEELFWKPDTKRIFTDKFVTIRLENEVIYGTGLDAAQDMSDYTIKNPEGEFEVKEDQ